MAIRRSFKSDESFLEKISIGAIGTKRVFDNLKNQGHNPLELERGSMSFKIWKNIKIKRLRVPDLLCVNCGRRVESRAKTSLEISMSHSTSDPERSWDFGLDNADLVAFVACERTGKRPIDWLASEIVQYISVGDLRAAEKSKEAILVQPKGAEEGFESRVNWPAVVVTAAGVIVQITSERLQYRRQTDNRTISLSLTRKGLRLKPLVDLGNTVSKSQIVASVVPVVDIFPCARDATEADYLRLLESTALSKRYASAKALSFFASESVTKSLTDRLRNLDEHIYVKLEAAASLARQGNQTGLAFIKERLADAYPQHRLEAVIVLGEIATNDANQLLIETLLDSNQQQEIRAGAAWALGEIQNKSSMSALIESFAAVDYEIRAEAARALAKLASQITPDIVRQLPGTSPEKRPGIAWALSKSGNFKVQDLLDGLVDDDARHWIAYILGTQDQTRFLDEIERLKAKDSEIYFAVTVLWKIMTSWVYDLEVY